jgi:hypothetical protein
MSWMGRALLAVLDAERRLQVVLPGAGGRDEEGLYLPRVEVAREGGFGVDEVVQAHEHGLAYARAVVERLRLEGVAEDGLDSSSVLGVEAVPRDEDEAGQEAPEGVSAYEES